MPKQFYDAKVKHGIQSKLTPIIVHKTANYYIDANRNYWCNKTGRCINPMEVYGTHKNDRIILSSVTPRPIVRGAKTKCNELTHEATHVTANGRKTTILIRETAWVWVDEAGKRYNKADNGFIAGTKERILLESICRKGAR